VPSQSSGRASSSGVGVSQPIPVYQMRAVGLVALEVRPITNAWAPKPNLSVKDEYMYSLGQCCTIFIYLYTAQVNWCRKQ